MCHPITWCAASRPWLIILAHSCCVWIHLVVAVRLLLIRHLHWLTMLHWVGRRELGIYVVGVDDAAGGRNMGLVWVGAGRVSTGVRLGSTLVIARHRTLSAVHGTTSCSVIGHTSLGHSRCHPSIPLNLIQFLASFCKLYLFVGGGLGCWGWVRNH